MMDSPVTWLVVLSVIGLIFFAISKGSLKKIVLRVMTFLEIEAEFQSATNDEKRHQEQQIDGNVDLDCLAMDKEVRNVPQQRSNTEDVAIRQLEHQYSTHILRQIRIERSPYIFDGAFEREGKVYGVEVKSIRGVGNAIKCLDMVRDSYLRFPEKVQRAFVFLLCFVKPSGESLEEASVAISHICTVEYPFDVVVRIVDSSK